MLPLCILWTFSCRLKNYGTPDVFFLHSLQPSVLPSFLFPSFLNSSPCPAIAVNMYSFAATKCQRNRWKTLYMQYSIKDGLTCPWCVKKTSQKIVSTNMIKNDMTRYWNSFDVHEFQVLLSCYFVFYIVYIDNKYNIKLPHEITILQIVLICIKT